MINDSITQSVLQEKAQHYDIYELVKAPSDVQIVIYLETLRELDRFLDIGDVQKLSSKSLGVIKDDIFAIIAGIRDLRTTIPPGSVKSLDGALEALRRARTSLQFADGMFRGGVVDEDKTGNFLAELTKCREYIEDAINFLSPNNETPAEAPSITKGKQTPPKKKQKVVQQPNVPPAVNEQKENVSQSSSDSSKIASMPLPTAENAAKPPPVVASNQPSATPEPTAGVPGYSKDSRLALARADRLCQSSSQPCIYSAHLLVALYSLSGDSPAFTFLSLFGLDRKQLSEGVLGPSIDEGVLDQIIADELNLQPDEIARLNFSKSVRSILEKAQGLAQTQKANEISPAHLFAALIEATETQISPWLTNALGTERYQWIRQKLAESDSSSNFSTGSVQSKAIAGGFYRPPTGMDDEATRKDLLSFKRHTDALASIILKPETRPPLVIGVYGPWGSGKSTFLQLMKESLQPSQVSEKAAGWSRIRQAMASWRERLRKVFSKPQGAELVIVEYNAWEYTDASKLWAGLVALIAQKIDEKLGWRGRWAYLLQRRWRKFIGAVILGLIPVGLLLLTLFSEEIGGRVKIWVTSNEALTHWLTAASTIAWTWLAYLLQKEPVTTFIRALTTKFDSAPASGVVHEIQDELESAIKLRLLPETDEQAPEFGQADLVSRIRANEYKIVVLIDELDRCPLERIVDILEAIKLFLAERIFIVLIAIDTRVAAEAIRLHYKDVENSDLPREYLEKIVQLPIQVPVADEQALKQYLVEHMPGFRLSSSSTPQPSPPDKPAPSVMPRPAVSDDQDSEPPIPISSTRRAISKLELPDTQIEFEHITLLAERFLESNPRRIKRLLNTYRYIKVLASSRREKVYQDDWQRHMLAWLAFTMRWPEFIRKAIAAAEALESGENSKDPSGDHQQPEASTKLFLVQVAESAGGKDEIPLSEDIEEFLPIDPMKVSAFAMHASNFLIETSAVSHPANLQENKTPIETKPPKGTN